uniref:Major facilitator superfamily (MFS) profile domain-containing protein n=1 Tax=Globodera rostochiensis TaxID=31243 RepID=A0A914GYX7_GLORO
MMPTPKMLAIVALVSFCSNWQFGYQITYINTAHWSFFSLADEVYMNSLSVSAPCASFLFYVPRLIRSVGGVRNALLLSSFPAVIGCLLQLAVRLSKTLPTLCLLLSLGRLLVGAQAGCSLCLLPLFIIETTPRHHRPFLSSLQVVFQSLATLIGLCAGSDHLVSLGEHKIEWLQIIGLAPTMFFAVFLMWLPDTPFRLLEKCQKVLDFDDNDDTFGEDVELKFELSSLFYYGSNADFGAIRSEAFERWALPPEGRKRRSKFVENWKGLLVGIFAAISFAFTADDLIDSYSADFLYRFSSVSPSPKADAEFLTAGLGLLLFFTSIFGAFLADRFGRRRLLISGLLGTAVSNAIAAFGASVDSASTVAIGFALTKAFIGFGAGAPAWFLTSELVSPLYVAQGQAISTGFLLIATGLCTLCFLPIQDWLGSADALLALSSVPALFIAVFLFLMLPETSDFSPVQIRHILSRQTLPGLAAHPRFRRLLLESESEAVPWERSWELPHRSQRLMGASAYVSYGSMRSGLNTPLRAHHPPRLSRRHSVEPFDQHRNKSFNSVSHTLNTLKRTSDASETEPIGLFRLFRLRQDRPERHYSPVAAARRPLTASGANVALVRLSQLNGPPPLKAQSQPKPEKPKLSPTGQSPPQQNLLLLSTFNVPTMKRAAAAAIFGTLIAASLLFRLADLLDVHCDSDEDCSSPRVCRFVCRRNCKSVGVLLAAGKDALASGMDSLDSGKHFLGTPGRQMAAPKRRKMHRKPTDQSAEDEAPFLSGKNPFSVGKMKEVTTPLTISEAELEAELRQNGSKEEEYDETPKGPSDFVTAPTANILEETDATTKRSSPPPPPSTSSEMHNFRETLTPKKSGTISEVRGRGRSPSPHLMTLSTSMELLPGENEQVKTTTSMRMIRPKTTTTAPTQIEDSEPPGISPQPPGFTPIPTSSSSTTTATTTVTEDSISATIAAELNNELTLPPSDQTQTTTDRKKSSREHYSGEEFIEMKKGKSGSDSFGGKTKFWPPLKLATSSASSSTSKPFSKTSQHKMTTLRTTIRNCPNPPVCLRNCGIVVDGDGCQSCQCLWISKVCDTDLDCAFTEGQFCDLGRCECADGWAQDVGMSGVCRKKQNAKLRGVPLVENALGHDQKGYPSDHSDQFALRLSTYPTKPFSDSDILSPSILSQSVPPKRQMLTEKPKREERLQWPGPCDSDDQCPPSLFCVEGDCWTLEAVKANERQRNANEENASESKMPNFPLPVPIVPVNRPQKEQSLLFPHFEDITAAEKPLGTETAVDYDDDEDAQSADNATTISPKRFPMARPTTALIQTVQTLRFSTNSFATTHKQQHNHSNQNQTMLKSNHNKQHHHNNPSLINNTTIIPTRSNSTFSIISITCSSINNTRTTHKSNSCPSSTFVGITTSGSTFIISNTATSSCTPTIRSYTTILYVSNTTYTSTTRSSTTSVSNTTTAGSTCCTVSNTVTAGSTCCTVSNTTTAGITCTVSNTTTAGSTCTVSNTVTAGSTCTVSNTVTAGSTCCTVSNTTTAGITSTQKGLQKIPNREVQDDVHLAMTSIRGTDLRHHPLRQSLPWEGIFPEAITPTILPNESTIGQKTEIGIGSAVKIEEIVNLDKVRRRIFLDYSRQNRLSRPIRVEHKNSKELIKDECEQSRDCGRRHFLCCAKRWCDLGGDCGMAKFCLPSCELTKLAHLSELSPEGNPRMDLVYD